MAEARAQERFRLVGCSEAPSGEQPADCPREVQLALEPFDRGGIRLGRKKPARSGTIADSGGGHARKLDSDPMPNNHQSAAYNITPHPSQISVAPVPTITLRRCNG